MKIPVVVRRYFPILSWGAAYNPRTFISTLTSAGYVIVIQIPQSMTNSWFADEAGRPCLGGSQ
jgi:hypothetical protein